MKAKMYMLLGGVMLSVVVAVFNVRQVYAGTSCFLDTEGNPFEKYICWLWENRISIGTGDGYYGPKEVVTREQMAAFLERQHKIPPTAGEIVVNAGHNSWKQQSSFNRLFNVEYLPSMMVATSRNAVGQWFVITPDIPVVLYDRVLRLTGVEFCYDTTDTAELAGIELVTFDGFEEQSRAKDYTWRSGKNCTTLRVTEPVLLDKYVQVSLMANVNYKVDYGQFVFKRTSFIFEATNEYPLKL